jgi:hypothetical protein
MYKVGTLLFDEIDNEFGIITGYIEMRMQATTVYVIDWQESGTATMAQFQFNEWLDKKRLEVCDTPGV